MDVVRLSKALYKALREREEELVMSVSSGIPSDWSMYQSMVGEIRGISFARQELHALLERMTDDADETLSS